MRIVFPFVLAVCLCCPVLAEFITIIQTTEFTLTGYSTSPEVWQNLTLDINQFDALYHRKPHPRLSVGVGVGVRPYVVDNFEACTAHRYSFYDSPGGSLRYGSVVVDYNDDNDNILVSIDRCISVVMFWVTRISFWYDLDEDYEPNGCPCVVDSLTESEFMCDN